MTSFRYHSFYEFSKFGVIGVLAASIHMSILVALVEHYEWQILFANVVAFYIAYLVSYFGHRYWTFRKRSATSNAPFKFLMLAIIGCLLNEMILFALTNYSMIHYAYAVLIAFLLVPPLVFMLSRFYIFK